MDEMSQFNLELNYKSKYIICVCDDVKHQNKAFYITFMISSLAVVCNNVYLIPILGYTLSKKDEQIDEEDLKVYKML